MSNSATFETGLTLVKPVLFYVYFQCRLRQKPLTQTQSNAITVEHRFVHYNKENKSMSESSARPADATQAKILIIGETPSIIQLVSKVMEHNGYHVTTATSADEGLSAISSGEHHLVIHDCYLSHLEGVKVMQTIRENKPTKGLPVILLCKTSDNISELDLWTGGCTYFSAIPLNPRNLTELVPSAIRDTGMHCEDGFVWPKAPKSFGQ
jgi:CheY-like chemotaxis protein